MIITQTPLRISLLGGNTDYPKYFKKYGGIVLTTTIDKYIYCIVKKRFDKQIWINYSEKEIVTKVKDIKHDLVREAMKLVGVTEGIEITFLSDIPSEGSGLGSSSAVTVGVLNALHRYKNESVTAKQLAEEACMIEVDILKSPIGYQDQYAVAFGGTNVIHFGKQKIRICPFNLDSTDLMLLYTGITRKANEVLHKMKLDKDILDINKDIIYQFISKYSKEVLGDCLDQYWMLKKQLNNAVSNKEIDNLYDKALEQGAYGGKIVGAGAGGFLLLHVDKVFRDNMKKLKLKELKFNISDTGSRVIFDIS